MMQPYEAIIEVFGDEIPDYIIQYGKSSLSVMANGKRNVIKAKDVAHYFAYEANSRSGMRTLGTISGDYRYIDDLADIAMEYFKLVNIFQLKRYFKELGGVID